MCEYFRPHPDATCFWGALRSKNKPIQSVQSFMSANPISYIVQFVLLTKKKRFTYSSNKKKKKKQIQLPGRVNSVRKNLLENFFLYEMHPLPKQPLSRDP